MQTPCAFVQTSTIYANPLAEITKLKALKNRPMAASAGPGMAVTTFYFFKMPVTKKYI
jgi:hypothetical protein